MKLSTRSTYGLRAMCELALKWGGGPVSVSFISEQEKLSVAYLEKLLNHLKHYNLVKSVRGSKGGYVLSRGPENISVGEVVRVLEGEGAELLFMNTEKDASSDIDETPAAKMISVLMRRLSLLISENLNSLTLRKLCMDPQVMRLVFKADAEEDVNRRAKEMAALGG